MPKVTLAKHDDVIECLPPDRANQAFGIGVLPGRSRCSWSVANAHRAKPSDECLAISAIAIANDIVRSGRPAASLRHLSRNPFSRRVCRHPQPHDLASTVPQVQGRPDLRKASSWWSASPIRSDLIYDRDRGTLGGRLKVIPLELPTDLGFQTQRAQWEANSRYGRGKLARVTVTGWRDGQGKLWKPNTVGRGQPSNRAGSARKKTTAIRNAPKARGSTAISN